MVGSAGDIYSVKVIIVNELGLHARSAAQIAKIVEKANSKVWIIKNGEKVDAASVIDILTLGCGKGSQIVLTIDDQSDIEILNSIKKLVEKGFGE